MKTCQAYVGMGGNIGDTAAILNQSLKEIEVLEGVRGLRCSNFYKTTPVASLPQGDYVNAVCTFETSLSPRQLHQQLAIVEKRLGKCLKPKDHPRVIDLDLLFHGMECVQEEDLEVPHPRWNQRLFVLIPLKELTDRLTYFAPNGERHVVDLENLIQNFKNVNREKLEILVQPKQSKR